MKFNFNDEVQFSVYKMQTVGLLIGEAWLNSINPIISCREWVSECNEKNL